MTVGTAIEDGAALDLALHGEVSDPRRYLERFGYTPPPLDRVAAAERPIEAEVNHGRWIWRCPCQQADGPHIPSGGGVVFVAVPLGWCARCENAAVGGRWRPLRLPHERAAIEAVLADRPDPETRNWWPGETIAELEAENAMHGLTEA